MDIFDLSTTTKIDGHDYLAAATQLIESLTNGWHVTGTFEDYKAILGGQEDERASEGQGNQPDR